MTRLQMKELGILYLTTFMFTDSKDSAHTWTAIYSTEYKAGDSACPTCVAKEYKYKEVMVEDLKDLYEEIKKKEQKS